MRILFADRVDADGIERLQRAGHTCTVEPDLVADQLAAAVTDHEVLVVRSTEVPAATFAAAPALELVVRAGAGTNTIDCQAAADHAVFVCNVPGRNAIAVAELTMGLLLAVDRHIADATADARRGHWDKARYSRADGLHGRTLAIVGLGDIGLAVAERAAAFGLTVIALDKPGRASSVTDWIETLGIGLVDDVDTLLAEADIVSLHVPAGDDTAGMVDDAFLQRLGDDAILLNTSRGDVVDEEALLRALDRGLRAGLDVFRDEPDEPGPFEHDIAAHPNVVSTHHIGASTAQAQAAVAQGTIEVIERYAAGEIINCVNLETTPLGECTLTIRHVDEVGVLAQVLAVLRRSGHNVQQMTNRIFAGGEAAVATIWIDGLPNPGLATELRAIGAVFSATIRRQHD